MAKHSNPISEPGFKAIKFILHMASACAALLVFQACFLTAAEDSNGREKASFKVEIAGSGRPMILIPGLGCGGNVWDGTVARFKDSYECHVITLAGFAGQPAIGEPFLEQVRDDLGKYIRSKKLQRPVIIGHSLGGIMAFWLGATMPEQVGPVISVDGLPYYPALMNANATPDSMQPLARTLRGIYNAQTHEQFAASCKGVLAGMIIDPKNIEKVDELSSNSDPKAVGQGFYEIMTTDLRSKIKDIRTPVLLIGATGSITDPVQKKNTEESYRLQVAAIPRHKVVFAPKARHFIQLDEPEFFFQEVESFLKEADTLKDK